MNKNESGFSLFELMIVIAIIAILSAIAVPNFLTYRDGANLRGAAFNLKSDLELAKMRGIRGGGNVVVKFTTTSPGYQIFQDNAASGHTAYSKDSDEAYIVNKTLDGFTVSTSLTSNVTPSLPANTLAFTNRAQALATGTVTLTYKGRSIVLTVNRLGLITM